MLDHSRYGYYKKQENIFGSPMGGRGREIAAGEKERRMNLKPLLLLIVGHVVTDMNTGALPAFLPFIKENLQLSYTMTASIILVLNATSSVIQPLFGYLSDRWPMPWLLPAGCFVGSLGMGLLGLSPSYGWILFFVAFSGLGQAGYHPEGFKKAHLLSGRKKASGMALFIMGGNLGFAVGPLLATLYFAHYGMIGSLWFSVPGAMMLVVFLTRSSWKVRESPSPDRERPVGPKRSRRGYFPVVLLILTVVLRSVARLGLLTFVPFYLINVLHRDPISSGKYLSIFLLAGALGTLVGGPVADRYGYKKIVLYSLGLTSVFLYLFLFMEGVWALVFFAVSGFLLISSHAVTMAMGQSFMPENLGMVSGLIMGLAMGIGGIATTLLGWVADHFGVTFTLQVLCATPVLAFFIFSLIPYPPRYETVHPESPEKIGT